MCTVWGNRKKRRWRGVKKTPVYVWRAEGMGGRSDSKKLREGAGVTK